MCVYGYSMSCNNIHYINQKIILSPQYYTVRLLCTEHVGINAGYTVLFIQSPM